MNAASNVVTMPPGQTYPHLAKAPIIEAIIEWRVKLDPNFPVDSLKRAGKILAPDYVVVREQRGFQYKVKAGKQLSHTTRDLGIQGYQFRSADKLRVATLKQDGFSFSRLRPYSRWEDVFTEAQRLWKIYREVAEPEEISRLGVRYINRIPLPMPVNDFSQYLRESFTVPPGVPQTLSSLLTRVVVHEPSSGVVVNIIQVIEGQIVEGTLPFILDIDAYHAKHIDPNLEDFGALFEQLREMKNRVFFATLTESAIEMFK
jgi:uncharacterized protein (TIGR04255 family)